MFGDSNGDGYIYAYDIIGFMLWCPFFFTLAYWFKWFKDDRLETREKLVIAFKTYLIVDIAYFTCRILGS